MYKCNRFILKELVWRGIYKEYQDEQWILWRKFDINLLKTIDTLAENYGITIINNWAFDTPYLGKQFLEYSGARPLDCPDGAKDSTHKNWDTADLKFKKLAHLGFPTIKEEYDALREHIIDHPECYPYVTTIESGEYAPTWLHLSTGNFRNEDGSIRIIKP